jgi:hypothetical protein
MDWITTIQRYAPLLGAIAIVAGAVSAGTLLSVYWLAGRAKYMADGPEIGRLAISLFYRRALPLVLVSLATGAAWSVGSSIGYLQGPRTVGLAGAAALTVVILVAVRGRARRAATSSV